MWPVEVQARNEHVSTLDVAISHPCHESRKIGAVELWRLVPIPVLLCDSNASSQCRRHTTAGAIGDPRYAARRMPLRHTLALAIADYLSSADVFVFFVRTSSALVNTKPRCSYIRHISPCQECEVWVLFVLCSLLHQAVAHLYCCFCSAVRLSVVRRARHMLEIIAFGDTPKFCGFYGVLVLSLPLLWIEAICRTFNRCSENEICENGQ